MDIEAFRMFCLSKKGVTEEFPFGPETLVYKVMGKAFALAGLDSDIFTVNLKCDPEYALELRDQYEEIKPGFHMNKKHWNTVLFEGGTLSDDFLRSLVTHSYDRVVSGLPKNLKTELGC